MTTFLVILTALICALLMIVVLIQNPKGGGIDSTFGGSQANQMFGAAKQTDLIEKVTWFLAAALFLVCIITAVYISSTSGVDINQLSPIE